MPDRSMAPDKDKILTMKYLVLDTNVYLHYKDFEQIDWKSLLNDDVTVCVPQRVFEEIAKAKELLNKIKAAVDVGMMK